MDDRGHLTLEDLEQYVQGRLDVRCRAHMQLHVQSCADCREALRACQDRERLAQELRDSSLGETTNTADD